MKTITTLTLLLAITLAVVSFFGAFIPGTYERDSASMGAQGRGQDMVDLFLVAPLLLVSLIFMLKNSRIAYYIYAGTLFYILYSFFIYCFGVYFNSLFILYCLILGLSLYAFIVVVVKMSQMEVHDWFTPRAPVRIIGTFLVIVAIMFYILWLKDIIPAVLNNTVPKAVSDYKLLVNPVHVLDIAIALPGLLITAIFVMKKKDLGYILAPVSLVFVIILAIALIGMVIMLKIENISDNISMAVIFSVLAVISAFFLIMFLKKLKTVGPGQDIRSK